MQRRRWKRCYFRGRRSIYPAKMTLKWQVTWAKVGCPGASWAKRQESVVGTDTWACANARWSGGPGENEEGKGQWMGVCEERGDVFTVEPASYLGLYYWSFVNHVKSLSLPKIIEINFKARQVMSSRRMVWLTLYFRKNLYVEYEELPYGQEYIRTVRRHVHAYYHPATCHLEFKYRQIII